MFLYSVLIVSMYIRQSGCFLGVKIPEECTLHVIAMGNVHLDEYLVNPVIIEGGKYSRVNFKRVDVTGRVNCGVVILFLRGNLGVGDAVNFISRAEFGEKGVTFVVLDALRYGKFVDLWRKDGGGGIILVIGDIAGGEKVLNLRSGGIYFFFNF